MTTRSELDRKFIAAVERLGRALRVARQQVATEHTLSLLQMQLIEHLAKRPDRRIGSLAEDLDVTQPTISDAVDALKGKGLATRQPDPNDGRASVVSLSPEGEGLAAAVAEELAPIIDQQRATSDEQQATALQVLLEEIKRLQGSGVITVNRSCLSCLHYQPPGETPDGRCLLLNETLRTSDLRVDCSEHVSL